MGRYLNPGNEAFKISVSSEIYVDKSNLISFTNKRLEQEKRYICVSRPRRFGKSMTANMLCAYYDKSCNSKDLFHHLNIFQNEKFEQYLNQYDVIFLNIQHFLRKAGSPENLANYIEEKVLAEIRKVYGNLIDETETSLPDALASII